MYARAFALLWLVAAGCSSSSDENIGLAWRLVSPLGHSSTMVGTLHLGMDAHQDLSTAVWTHFGQASTLVVETEVRAIEPSAYRALATLPSGQSLRSVLSDSSWQDLLTLLPSATPDALDRLRPWAVRSEIFHVLFPTTEGMDLTFLEEADRIQMPIATLETWQDQLRPLNQVPLAEDAASLVELLETRDIIKEAYGRLARAYRAGDAEQALIAGPSAWAMPDPGSALYDTFIAARNQAWMAELSPHLAAGGAFVAVGYAHLVGPSGLIETLQQQGYTATQLR